MERELKPGDLVRFQEERIEYVDDALLLGLLIEVSGTSFDLDIAEVLWPDRQTTLCDIDDLQKVQELT